MKQNARSSEPAAEAVEPELDRALVGGLVAQAKVDGIRMTGEGGLLAQLTKLVVEGALEGELTDHLGRESGERADEGRSGNYRNGHGAKTAPTEAAAVERFAEFRKEWGLKYPAAIRLWENAWAEFVPFLSFGMEIRKIICTTNAIESVNARIRKAARARGHFPTTRPPSNVSTSP